MWFCVSKVNSVSHEHWMSKYRYRWTDVYCMRVILHEQGREAKLVPQRTYADTEGSQACRLDHSSKVFWGFVFEALRSSTTPRAYLMPLGVRVSQQIFKIQNTCAWTLKWTYTCRSSVCGYARRWPQENKVVVQEPPSWWKLPLCEPNTQFCNYFWAFLWAKVKTKVTSHFKSIPTMAAILRSCLSSRRRTKFPLACGRALNLNASHTINHRMWCKSF